MVAEHSAESFHEKADLSHYGPSDLSLYVWQRYETSLKALKNYIGFIPSTSYVVISYLVMWLFPRHVSHYIVFVVNAALLSATHIHKMIYYDKFWGADITAVMMLNLCKISAIAINYRDGSVPVAKRDTELKSSNTNV